MSKRLLLAIALAAGTFSTASAQTRKAEVELKLAEVHEATFPTTLADAEFARLVNERTGGRIHITVFDNGQLGQDEKAVVEQTQMGALDFARISVAPVAQFARELDVLSLPYLYRDGAHMWKVLSGPIGQKMLGALDKANLVGLCYYDAGARSFYTTRKPIKTLADLKGMKIRVQQSKLMMDLVKALGGSPTPLALGDIYSGLQTNVIDGAENNWPSYISFSHYEVARNFTVDGHTRIPEILVASKAALSKLSKADRDVIAQAAKDSVEFQKTRWIASEKENEAKAKAAGCNITTLDAKELAEFQKAVAPIYGDYKQYADLIKQIQETK